ncbi:hypothetical protein VKT23_020550 [Stygiomarasmius scandens]|uniref:Uncharacterized protein n=1 Tax=Marasmiellus scandens TaxID=2682957 RepID=A0ABR1ILH1_9AGAR
MQASSSKPGITKEGPCILGVVFFQSFQNPPQAATKYKSSQWCCRPTPLSPPPSDPDPSEPNTSPLSSPPSTPSPTAPPIVPSTQSSTTQPSSSSHVRTKRVIAAFSPASQPPPTKKQLQEQLEPAASLDRKPGISTTSRKNFLQAQRRQKQWEQERTHFSPVLTTAHHVVINSNPIQTELDSDELQKSTSGYLGRERVVDGDGRVWRLDELIARPSLPFSSLTNLIIYRQAAMPIVDCNNRIIGIVVGPPISANNWTQVHQQAAELLEKTRQKLSFDAKYLVHHRGRFAVIPVGISYGGGQEYAKHIWHKHGNRPILDTLLSSKCIQRLAGHASKAFETWAPKLFAFYRQNIDRLLAEDERLFLNFDNSIWACATFNFGPQTVTVQHLDHLNYIYGWCAITALGDFNYKNGGHFVLWDLSLVIELPPGCTILIPSSYIRHSNTPIGSNETRYSFTQYTAGGLFRWVDDNRRVRAHMSRDELKDAQARQWDRINDSMNLYSMLDELQKC